MKKERKDKKVQKKSIMLEKEEKNERKVESDLGGKEKRDSREK